MGAWRSGGHGSALSLVEGAGGRCRAKLAALSNGGQHVQENCSRSTGPERHRRHHRTRVLGSVDADDYLLHEDGEKIFFLIKSKKDEYCFTNLALIHVDGDWQVSSKRSIKRYEYASSRIENVSKPLARSTWMWS